MGKSSTTPLITPCVDVNHFKKIKTNPLLFVDFKLIYLHIYVHSNYQRE
jgi:hypothetical protein